MIDDGLRCTSVRVSLAARPSATDACAVVGSAALEGVDDILVPFVTTGRITRPGSTICPALLALTLPAAARRHISRMTSPVLAEWVSCPPEATVGNRPVVPRATVILRTPGYPPTEH